jgi:hypothetical protein
VIAVLRASEGANQLIASRVDRAAGQQVLPRQLAAARAADDVRRAGPLSRRGIVVFQVFVAQRGEGVSEFVSVADPETSRNPL